ncbi:MAG TPA: c-type cytochrome [Aquabacterium sp.]|nr:c-type cytochrome [Aquabacterium sp.]
MQAIFRSNRTWRRWVPTVALLGLAACGNDTPPEPGEPDVARAESLRPADPRLAEKYERACVTCHATRSAAPLTGFAPAWAPRLRQGMDTLVAHARDGFKGMPAKGLCSDCTDADLHDLIAFMSHAQ